MSQPLITSYEHIDSFLADVLDAFVTVVEQSVQERGVCRVALAGGSTPKRLYQSIARSGVDLSGVHWFMGDERNVPLDHSESNFRMAQESLLSPARIPKQNIFPVPVNVNNPAAAALRYESTLREQFADDTVPASDTVAAGDTATVSDKAEAFPAWDLVLLGMGEDAHTASLFPDTAALDVKDRWFVDNWVEKLSAHRYTLTPAAINSGREIWFLLSGESKRQAVANVLGSEHVPHRYPSQLIRPTRFFMTTDAMPAVSDA
jgi:6-phosphogluconolactonase